MRNYIKKAVYCLVLIGFSSAQAGSYEDFFVAVKRDDPRTVTALLQRGFDPNTLGPTQLDGLYMALQEGSLKVAQALIEWPKTKVETRTTEDESPLMMAALKGHLDLVKKLIGRGADVVKPGWSPLHYAATNGDTAIIALLLEHHAYIDAESPNGTTPLMMAAQYGSTQSVKLLLEAGADPTLKNQLGLNALDFAQRGSRPDAIAILSGVLRTRPSGGKW